VKNIFKIFILTGLLIVAFPACKNEPKVDLTNPFFKEFDTPFNVPPFEKIMAKHYLPAFEKGMADCRVEIEKIVSNSQKPTFRNTAEAFDKTGAPISFISLVGMIPAITATSGPLSSTMMPLKLLKRKEYSIKLLQFLSEKIFWRKTVQWMQCRCL
jgi:peptidyl-dipeptidase Dcp